MKTKILITFLFALSLASSALAAQCWGPDCDTGVSIGGARNSSPISRPASTVGSSAVSKSNSRTEGSFLSGTILNDTSDCSRRGRAILEDGPCMKACPGNCDRATAPSCGCGSAEPAPCQTAAPRLAVARPINYINPMNTPLMAQCNQLAPIDLQWIDFRIPEEGKVSFDKNLGDYRFRIFGCRRPARNIILNQGRALQKDMRLIEVFGQTVGDCLNIIKIPSDLCLNPRARLPEYILTAEIVDFHMNVCDEFDFYDARTKNARKGTSEITVVWRLMDLSKSNVLWRGTSSGYGELTAGDPFGETTLIEKAFADAANTLRQDPGFEAQLMNRPSPRELSIQRSRLIDIQRIVDPVKCEYGADIVAIRSGQKPPVSPLEKRYTEVVEEVIIKKPAPVVEEVAVTKPADKEVTVKEPVAIVEKVTVEKTAPALVVDQSTAKPADEEVTIKEPVAVVEKVTVEKTAPAPVVDQSTADTIFDVTLIPEETAPNPICIYDREAYGSLTPENMNLIKSSLVMVSNAGGKKGSGLLVSETMVLTSANMILKNQNAYTVKTTDGRELTAKAFRVNVKKNTALLVLDKKTAYNKLAIGLELPRIGRDEMTSLGILAADPFTIDKSFTTATGKALGYRYSDDLGTELIIDTVIQGATDGGALIDNQGQFRGMSISGKRLSDGPDTFIPFETVLQSVGLEICGREFETRIQTTTTELIEKPIAQAPEQIPEKKRK